MKPARIRRWPRSSLRYVGDQVAVVMRLIRIDAGRPWTARREGGRATYYVLPAAFDVRRRRTTAIAADPCEAPNTTRLALAPWHKAKVDAAFAAATPGRRIDLFNNRLSPTPSSLRAADAGDYDSGQESFHAFDHQP